mmetsp:Transcript_34126/g.28810  ORF Transcript_34126/g.28810 Transcript_34126/m.28810 type:complete len:143 (+) Transcript_34126:1-429(+)
MELKGRCVGVMGTLALTCAVLVIVGDRSVGHSELKLEPGAEEAARIVGELGNGAPVVMVKGHGLFEVVPLRSLLDGKACLAACSEQFMKCTHGLGTRAEHYRDGMAKVNGVLPEQIRSQYSFCKGSYYPYTQVFKSSCTSQC